MTDHLNTRTRWLALVILCVGDLMIVVDTTWESQVSSAFSPAATGAGDPTRR